MLHVLKQLLIINNMSKIFSCILLMGMAVTASAHTYFFGVTDISLNTKSRHIEVIHQLTAHDVENAIAEIEQIHFSAEHPSYNQLVQTYIENRFSLYRENNQIEMNWIGFEVKRGQLFVYQESKGQNYLMNLVVKNSILVDTYVKQVNTVNYRSEYISDEVQGSLTFDRSLRVASITSSE